MTSPAAAPVACHDRQAGQVLRHRRVPQGAQGPRRPLLPAHQPLAARLRADVREDRRSSWRGSSRRTPCWSSPRSTWWLAIPLAVSLGLAMAPSASTSSTTAGTRPTPTTTWVNRLMAMTLDLLGGSSYVWDHKHNTVHHTYANITGHDDDIEVGFLGRLSPHQKRLRVPPLPALVPLAALRPAPGQVAALRRLPQHRPRQDRQLPVRPPQGQGPGGLHRRQDRRSSRSRSASRCCSTRRGWSSRSTCFANWVNGILLAIVFQLAHVVEEAEFPMPDDDDRQDRRPTGPSTRCRRPSTSPAATAS